MRLYETYGDLDYAWINCCEAGMYTVLDQAANEGAETDHDLIVDLEVGGYGANGDWVETDCPNGPIYGLLLLSERAIAAFGPMLTDAGYFFSTRLTATTRYKLFICQRQIDALDQERSELTRFDDGGVWNVLRHELDDDLLQGMDVLRLKHLRARFFVSDRFVAVAKAHGLTGFVFTEVWSSDTGGVPLPLPGIPVEQVRGEFARNAQKKRQALRKELARRRHIGQMQAGRARRAVKTGSPKP